MTDDQAWVPNACTLPIAEQPLRLAELDNLFANSLREQQRVSPTTLRWRLDPQATAVARDLTARESSCCSFFSFTLAEDREDARVEVDVSATHAHVLDALEQRAAAWIPA
jgi:hypothetical protein